MKILSVTAFYEGFDDNGCWQDLETSCLIRVAGDVDDDALLEYMLCYFDREDENDDPQRKPTLTRHGEVGEDVVALAEAGTLPLLVLTYEPVKRAWR